MQMGPARCAQCGSQPIVRGEGGSLAFCTTCGVGVCWLDGIQLESHPACAACHILVGPRHLTRELDSRGLCARCAADVDRKGAYQTRTAY